MNARLAASSARRSAGYVPMRWPATVRSPSRLASCARTSATGAQNNAPSTTWTIASAVPRRAAVVRRLAAKWPPNRRQSRGPRSTSARIGIEPGSLYALYHWPGRHSCRASRQVSASSARGSRYMQRGNRGRSAQMTVFGVTHPLPT